MASERTAVEAPEAPSTEHSAILSPLADFLLVLTVSLLVAIGGVLLLVP